ncbi:MAG: hypothetical protein Q7U38_17815 [Methylobacter sp.]|nr:hypothetical protein [Methylobacter sp.]MDP2099130.1 hypothetical protein [Methylobacter sp.]MDP2429956.1 hypothetical protein [Methylobacter sp.]MDP3054801.1 hypothetical protein [Methylobacter sp.]MDP3361215.1 hypothetical protein [Methylobacter sp.]
MKKLNCFLTYQQKYQQIARVKAVLYGASWNKKQICNRKPCPIFFLITSFLIVPASMALSAYRNVTALTGIYFLKTLVKPFNLSVAGFAYQPVLK